MECYSHVELLRDGFPVAQICAVKSRWYNLICCITGPTVKQIMFDWGFLAGPGLS